MPQWESLLLTQTPEHTSITPFVLALQVCTELGIATVGELAAVPLPRLESAFGDKDAQWLYAVARGVTGKRAGHLLQGGVQPCRPQRLGTQGAQ